MTNETNDSRKFLDPRMLAKLHGLKLRARHIVEGFVAGLHRSPFQGFSIEFAEHREYTPGDDLRYVDWKVYGRTDKVYLKQYEDETNLVCYIVLDVSESMGFQGPESPMTKLEYAQCMAASMAWLVLQQQDAVGIATFDSEVRALLRPSSNATQLQQAVQVLEGCKASDKTSAGPIFHELAQRLSKRGVVVILSDLFDHTESLLAGLKHFRHRRHDVILFHVLDPAELEFPFHDPTLFQGLENLPDVHVDPAALRRAYLHEFETFLKSVQAGCRSQQIDYQLMRTDTPLDRALSTYLAARGEKVR